VNVLTEIVLISRSRSRYYGARGEFLTLKNIVVLIFIKLFYIQIDSVRERISTQACHLLVIFVNFENYLEQD